MNKKFYNSYSSKVVLTLVFASIIPLIIYLYSNNMMIKNYFSLLENKTIESHVEHADKILESELEDLSIVAKDYAAWDDTYEVVAEVEPDLEWIKENISEWIPYNFGMDLLMLTASDHRIIDTYGIEETKVEELLGSTEVKEVLDGKYDDSIGYEKDNFPKGITSFNGKLYLFSVSPILRSDFEGPARGALILGREISPVMLENIKDKFGYDISIAFKNTLISTPEKQTLSGKFIGRLLKSDEKIIELDDNYLAGQKILADISGISNVRLYVFQSRDVFLATLKLLKNNGQFILLFSIAFIFLLSYLLKNIIVSPILSLEKQLGKMNKYSTLDYIDMKGANEIKSLAHSFNTLVENLTAKEQENRILKEQNYTDHLTSLHNHRFFHQFLAHKSNSDIDSISIIFMDIDKFKVVNDLHGHMVGDKVLKTIGNILKKSMSNRLHSFRYGGEEFVVIAENYSLDDAFILAEDLRSKIVKSKELQNQCEGMPITVSVGLAAYPEHSKEFKKLVNKADRAMYFAKQSGRNQTFIYDKDIEIFLNKNGESFRKKEILLDSALAFAAAIDAKDHYTGRHSETVTKFSLLLAEKIGLNNEEKSLLRIGALLHDCGKIGVPDNIIGKPTRLSPKEFNIIKTHTTLGETILKYIIEEESVMACVRNHHEKWNGSGYPDALSGEQIPLNARIVSLADAFHAMISDRPYRKAFPIDIAFEELRRNSGTQFDPSLVEKFIQAVQESYEMVG